MIKLKIKKKHSEVFQQFFSFCYGRFTNDSQSDFQKYSNLFNFGYHGEYFPRNSYLLFNSLEWNLGNYFEIILVEGKADLILVFCKPMHRLWEPHSILIRSTHIYMWNIHIMFICAIARRILETATMLCMRGEQVDTFLLHVAILFACSSKS